MYIYFYFFVVFLWSIEKNPKFRYCKRRKFDYFYLEGTRLAQKGEIDAAFDMLRQAAAVDTMSASVKYALASFPSILNR